MAERLSQDEYNQKFKSALPADYVVPEWKTIWMNWVDPRSLRLSKFGYTVLTEQLGLTPHLIKYPPNLMMFPRTLVQLDRHVRTPFFLRKNGIVVFDERTAFDLAIYAGDIVAYADAKDYRKKP